MKQYRKEPNLLPEQPCIVRDGTSSYRLWSGVEWIGSVYRLGRFWFVSVRLRNEHVCEFKDDALSVAEQYALEDRGLQ